MKFIFINFCIGYVFCIAFIIEKNKVKNLDLICSNFKFNCQNANTENKYRCEYYKTLCQNTTMYYIYLGVAMVTHIFMILIYHSWQLDKR